MNYHLLAPAWALLLYLSASVAQAEILGQARLEVDDLLGNPINSISLGGDFLLKGFVQDVRNSPVPPPNASGVFGAGFDITFDQSLTTAKGPISFGSFFPLSQSATFLPGKVHDIGAYSTSINTPGQAEQFLFSVQFHAASSGSATFTPSESLTPGHEFLIYGIDTAIPPSQVKFIPVSIVIVPEPSNTALGAMALVCWGTMYFRRRLARNDIFQNPV